MHNAGVVRTMGTRKSAFGISPNSFISCGTTGASSTMAMVDNVIGISNDNPVATPASRRCVSTSDLLS